MTRISPESTNANEIDRYAFLVLLVEVLAKVGTTPHVPGNEIAFVLMEAKMFLARRFGDAMPNFPQYPPGSFIVRHAQKNVKVWRTSALKLKNPEICNTWVTLPDGVKKLIKVFLDGASVRTCDMVCHTKL